MGLRKKTFLYSIVLAAVMIAFVTGYFVLMLPSLYVNYVMNDNLESVMEIQKGYMESKSYDNLTVKNPSATFSLEVPNEGSEIYVAGKFFRIAVSVRDEELQALLDDVRNRMKHTEYRNAFQNAEDSADWSDEAFLAQLNLWKDRFQAVFAGQRLMTEDYPIEVNVEQKGEQGAYQGEYYKVHAVSDNLIVYEAGVSDGNYGYTTYAAMGWTEDCFVLTVLPTMTPRMEEISPIVLESLPMIVAVIFLIVLVSSRFFSGKIVNPIIRLADYAESISCGESADYAESMDYADGFDSDSKDEIGVLGRNLHELYGKLRDNYEELERKNRILEEENERQEVFLRASSHQLKTPIAAALLLVEGMMNEVGKYKNTQEYLPEVKTQLLSMRKIVEDILSLNYHVENMQREDVELAALAQELVRAYAIQVEKHGLHVTIEGGGILSTDREILKKIVDNMLSNAVQYTPAKQRIVIEICENGLCIVNYGVTIEKELLPNIFEPFVSRSAHQKGKGLGLYVAAYYSRLMGYRLEIGNVENGVRAKLFFTSSIRLNSDAGEAGKIRKQEDTNVVND